MSTGGFYEGGYSGYSGGGSAGGNAGYNNYNNGGGGGNYSQQQQQQHYPQQQQNYSHQQQVQYPQQQQQQQQPDPTLNFWNPSTAMAMSTAAAAFSNSSDSRVMFGVAESMGKQFLETSWAKAVPGLERSMLALRPYFAVDNGYVKSKMGRVLFPFVYKDWARQVRA